MNDPEGVQFLQWCLPRLGLRWKGYRKVRRQFYKHIRKRMHQLGLTTFGEYRNYLEHHPGEWSMLDSLSWIPISRFYRDKRVYEFLQQEVLPQLAEKITARGETELRCWSLGCAAGEEPYSLAIIWKSLFASQFPNLAFRVLATDINPKAIRRAETGCYSRSSLKDLSQELVRAAFVASGELHCLQHEYRVPVQFLVQDIRQEMPHDSFHLIFCRYLIFTYFEEQLQREMVKKIEQKLEPSGALVIGKTESLPEGEFHLEPWSSPCRIYKKSDTYTFPAYP